MESKRRPLNFFMELSFLQNIKIVLLCGGTFDPFFFFVMKISFFFRGNCPWETSSGTWLPNVVHDRLARVWPLAKCRKVECSFNERCALLWIAHLGHWAARTSQTICFDWSFRASFPTFLCRSHRPTCRFPLNFNENRILANRNEWKFFWINFKLSLPDFLWAVSRCSVKRLRK